MAIQLGSVKFEELPLFKQLRGDLRDDWFPDPFVFADMLESGVATARIVDNFERNHGKYVPTKRSVFNIPKPNFTLRLALETSLCDRILYHALTSYLVPFFDQLIPWHVFSHRYDYVHPNKRYMFKPPVPAWKDFVGAARSAIAGESYLLSTDLNNYYEHIDLARLKTIILSLLPAVNANANQKSDIRSSIDLLFDCLGHWSFETAKGLPQNRDPSSFLANVYMHPVDMIMQSKGYEGNYFRYMDDIKIVCRDELQARRALKDLSLALREIGLSVNSKKTVIVAGSSQTGVAACFEEGAPEIQHLDEMWRTRSMDVIMRCIPRLKDLTLRLIKEGRADTRDFRYCIGRLEFLALCEDFEIPDTFFSEVTPAIIEGLVRNPSSTDLFTRYLLAVPTEAAHLQAIGAHLCDGDRSLYTWQNYRLWCLLARKEYSDPVLIARAREIIEGGKDDATRAGATLYNGSLGGDLERTFIAENFDSLSSFLGQRSALIAVHELPYYPLVERDIRPYVREDLKGVYKTLHDGEEDYFAPIERMPLSRAVDLERDY